MSIQLVIFENVAQLKEFCSNTIQDTNLLVFKTQEQKRDVAPVEEDHITLDSYTSTDVAKHLPAYDETYTYDADECTFKTKKGKKKIWLSGTEGLDILEYTYQGKKPKWIFYNMEFTHDVVTKSTIYNFIRRCKEGKMDYAIKNVCENPRINEDFSKYSMILKKLQE